MDVRTDAAVRSRRMRNVPGDLSPLHSVFQCSPSCSHGTSLVWVYPMEKAYLEKARVCISIVEGTALRGCGDAPLRQSQNRTDMQLRHHVVHRTLVPPHRLHACTPARPGKRCIPARLWISETIRYCKITPLYDRSDLDVLTVRCVSGAA